MANKLSQIGSKALAILLPSRTPPKGVAVTSTFSPSNAASVLSAPTYRDHLTDIFTQRTALDSRSLLKELFKNDPDMSASVHAFLTVADTKPVFLVKDADGQIDRAGQKLLEQVLTAFTTRSDYSKGFKVVNSLTSVTEAFRYMMLLRGAIGAELVINQEFMPVEMRQVDMGTLEWFEKSPNQYTPQQTDSNGKKITLDIPTFFATWFRQDPTTIYSTSPFVSAINTIAARQQVINDLYRIMQITGFPRMEVTVLEDVVLKNAPVSVKSDPVKQNAYLRTQLQEIRNMLSQIGPEQTFVHFDSVQPGMLNEKAAGVAINIDSVMNALNAQNQAGLRTMATILGRGTSGVNTATVEARVFSMSAEALNKPIADMLSQMFTLAIRLNGSQSKVECSFEPVELRSALELETNLLVKSQRLRTDLSDGLITDDEYHLMMYGRLGPDGLQALSGTSFLNGPAAASVDSSNISPNADPLGRSVAAPKAQKPARDAKAGKAKLSLEETIMMWILDDSGA
jgi:hypothetical protein